MYPAANAVVIAHSWKQWWLPCKNLHGVTTQNSSPSLNPKPTTHNLSYVQDGWCSYNYWMSWQALIFLNFIRRMEVQCLILSFSRTLIQINLVSIPKKRRPYYTWPNCLNSSGVFMSWTSNLCNFSDRKGTDMRKNCHFFYCKLFFFSSFSEWNNIWYCFTNKL